LLGLIATAKRPPTAVAVKNVDPQQQKKEAKRKNKDDQEMAGDILVMPFLSQFPLPPDGSPPTSELVINYYGVIMAYASIQQVQTLGFKHSILQSLCCTEVMFDRSIFVRN
jgi:hypothetical protein